MCSYLFEDWYPWDYEPDYDWLSLVDLFYEWDGWELEI